MCYTAGRGACSMPDREKINAQGIEVTFYTRESHADYMSLTDIARYKSAVPKDVIKSWLRTHDVIEFLGLWEKLHNPRFNGVEFDSFKNRSGSNSFTLSPSQWIERTDAAGMVLASSSRCCSAPVRPRGWKAAGWARSTDYLLFRNHLLTNICSYRRGCATLIPL